MHNVEPQKEHHWLQQLVGEWTYEQEMGCAPGEAPQKFTGTETVRSVGGLWVMCEGKGNMPGVAMATTFMTLGYDPAKKKFVGTFIGSMMTYMWVYEGELDSTGKVLTLDCEGPSFTAEGKTAKYKDIIEIKSDDHRVLISNCQGEDGKWTKFMEAPYRRKR